MELTEDENLKNYGKKCGRSNQNMLLPYEFERTCVSCGYNVIKRKHDFSKIQRKRINFINRLKYAEPKIFCICVDVYKIYENIDFDKTYEVLSTLKNKRIKINNSFTEKYKDMLEKPDFKQDYYSRTAIGIYKIGHDSIRLMNWLAYYDRSFYENIHY